MKVKGSGYGQCKDCSVTGSANDYDYPGFHAGDIDFKIGTRCGAFIDDRCRCINFVCVPKTRNCCKYLLITGECEFSSNATASEENIK